MKGGRNAWREEGMKNEWMKERRNEWREEGMHEERKEWRTNEWSEEGMNEGKKEWMKGVRNAWKKEGINEGMKLWKNEWRKEGRKEGINEGRKECIKWGRNERISMVKVEVVRVHKLCYPFWLQTYQYMLAWITHCPKNNRYLRIKNRWSRVQCYKSGFCSHMCGT